MLRHTWKLTLEYDGTRYAGWQQQPNARTIAGEVKKAAESILRAPVEIQGAGRTDAGVHALGQVAHMRATMGSPPPPERLSAALNQELPADIAILGCEPAPPAFHARHDAVARRYVYRISRRKTAFDKKFVWWIRERLDASAMGEAAALIPGRHDFTCFRAPDPARPKESAVVVVNSALVEPDGDLLLFRIEASHFLWRMVRRLVGALVRTGSGEIPVSCWKGLLAGDCQGLDLAAWTAPASGLFLEEVVYRTGRAPQRRPESGLRPSKRAQSLLS